MQKESNLTTPAKILYQPRSPLAWIGQAFLAVLVILALVLIVPKAVGEPTLFVQFVLNGLQLGFVYALIALGYTMVYGIV